MADEANPASPSSDYQNQIGFWSMVDDILRGVEAMRAIGNYTRGYATVPGPSAPYASIDQLRRSNNGGRSDLITSPYLPSFPKELQEDYEYRRQNSPMTNVYADISRNLSSKPFSKTLELADDAADDLKELSQNIDGQGNNLHVFARETFKSSIDKGIDWILVDYTKVAQGVTLADERNMGARPYWVHVPADRMIAIYSAFFNGQEIITHARIYECVSEQRGYEEITSERVRVLDRMALYGVDNKIFGYAPATWQLWEKQTSKDENGKDQVNWVLIDGGNITIGIIPLVPFAAGKRRGQSWQVDPPLKDLAYMQVEEFQQESNLKYIKTQAAFPMLAGNGIAPPGDGSMVKTGPNVVLFAPPSDTGSSNGWEYIEPAATSLTFLKTDLDGLRKEMRDLGMQPLTDANLTVITTANVAMKAHNQVQAWALGLKDALEQAWIITCKWLGRDESPMVNVHTDFGVDISAEAEPALLLQAAQAGKISDETLWEELKRRGVLSDDFDADEEAERLAEQQQGMDLQSEVTIDPVTGRPIQQQATA